MTTDSELPIGRPLPRSDSFEVIGPVGPVLTAEEKTWPLVALQARSDAFDRPATDQPKVTEEVTENIPLLALTLHLTDDAIPDTVELGKALDALVRVVNTMDRAAGGDGYRLGSQLAEAGKVGLTLLPVSSTGAESRIASLISRVTSTGLDIPWVKRITAVAA